MQISGTPIENAVYTDDSFLYCIQNNIIDNPKITDMSGEREIKQGFKASGFYVYDVDRMMEGYLETYKLFSTVAGVNNQLDCSRFSQRFSFLANFDSI